MHRTLLKVVVNTPLRFVQRSFTDRPLLLASIFDDGVWTGRYVFARIQMRDGWSWKRTRR
jgi:hypothetical protein